MIKKSILMVSLLGTLFGDTVVFNNGAVVSGKVTKQSNTTVSIDVKGSVTTYAKSDIKSVKLDAVVSAPPPAPVVAKPPVVDSNAPLFVSAGTELYIVTTSALNSQQHKKGHTFKMKLENDLLAKDGRIVSKKGTDVYGVVVESEQAGRLFGKSSMIITLTGLSSNGVRLDIKTNAINILAPKKQGRDTAGKVARGAVIGAMINGSDGAKDGAKVGGGIALLTRGKATGVNAGTLLEFTLTSNIEIK